MAATADPVWLTIVGDANNPAVETVLVDAASPVAFDRAIIVNIKVNRSLVRKARDGLDFRSYESTVLINCNAGLAWHRSQVLFSEALWSGTVRTVTYAENEMPLMAFPGMQVNPKDRIIKAACAIESVKTR